MRILIIQTAFIGDVVLTTGLIRAARENLGAGDIHVVTTPQGREILAGLKNVTCHALDKKSQSVRAGLASVRASLGDAPFDLVLCVHRSVRSLWLGRSVKSKRRIAYRSFWSKLLGYETVEYPAYADETHYADKTLALLAPFEVTAKRAPELAVDESSRNSARVKIARAVSAGERYIVMSPFSVWGTKMWFADRFARLGEQLTRSHKLPIVIIGGPTPLERTIGGTIAEKITAAGGHAVSVAGQTSLGELKAIMQGASLLVANDSAPVHIAAAFDIPTVAIFGPTARRWGFFPLAHRSVVVERPALACRPCHIHGPQKCPLKHFKCMDEIQVEDVAKAVETLIRA